MTESTCRCMGVKQALQLALVDRPAPNCPEHDPEPGVDMMPTALNDDTALAAKIGAHLAKENH